MYEYTTICDSIRQAAPVDPQITLGDSEFSFRVWYTIYICLAMHYDGTRLRSEPPTRWLFVLKTFSLSSANGVGVVATAPLCRCTFSLRARLGICTTPPHARWGLRRELRASKPDEMHIYQLEFIFLVHTPLAAAHFAQSRTYRTPRRG